MVITRDNFRQFNIGVKAENLFLMQEQGINVPELFCTDIDSAVEAVAYMEERYSEGVLFAVRSSSSVEDSGDVSFAGQFHTCLRVKKSEIKERIEQVAAPITSEGFQEYCRQNGLDPNEIHITVIIQQMIDADISGVIFTANPQGLLNETVIVAGRGTGDNVVENKTDTTTYYYNTTDRQFYYEKKGDAPLLANSRIEEVIEISSKIKEIFDCECDIEFAIKNETLYILQARPITTLKFSESPIVLDNSNISESYPGITLPLTQSFIRDAYYGVFRSVLLRLTGEKDTVARADDILRNMVDACNGRIYYRISNWYDIIKLLPFSKKIIPVWQEMLGVKTKRVTSHAENKAGFITHAKVTVSFFRLLISCPKLMEELDEYFSAIIREYRSVNLSSVSSTEILEHYQKILKMVSEKWDITLVNDMYSFIYTGLLKAYLKKETANQYISGLNGIESMKPVKELLRISKCAQEENRLEELKEISSNGDFYTYITKKNDSFCEELTKYIEQYGDRNVNELKLESKTFRTDPLLLVERILYYCENDTMVVQEEESKPSGGIAGFLAKRASMGIKNREKSRLHRSRLYGMMREMMLKVGENLTAEGKLSCQDDIFFLTYAQVEQAVKDGDIMVKTVSSVRSKYEMFRQLPAYSHLVFSDEVFDKNPTSVGEMQFAGDGEGLLGVPCSKGSVEGEVLLVEDPTEEVDTRDKILVTKMTDPGWVFLIAEAKGIVSEKGSLLSHTAIISRELNKPAVVGVDNITRILRNGDIIRIDGGSGEVKVISRKEGENESNQ